MFHPVKTNRGWELADSTGTLESEEISEVYPNKREAQRHANGANYGDCSAVVFDESRSSITGDNF